MTLSRKIKISFVVIILVPTLMILCFTSAISKYEIEELERSYDIEITDSKTLFDTTKVLDLITESIRERILISMNNEDFKPDSEKYWQNFDMDNDENIVGVIGFYNDKFVYNRFDKDEELVELLSRYDESVDISLTNYLMVNHGQYLIKAVPFEHDNIFGAAYIVGVPSNVVVRNSELILKYIIVCVLLLLLTGTCLSVWLYNSVLKPIKKLKFASENITKGNLDFQLENNSKDEFGQVYESFEEMRVHLKESIEENLKKETDSKELISNISHDLKTPITAIKGYVEGIMDGVADTPEKMDRYIKTIYNKANDMDKLIAELTMYTKIDTNSIPYNFVKLNVAEYFDDCIEEISTDLENRNFKLVYLNYTDKDTEVVADPEQIKRVINNIISNSIKYNDKENGIINIRIKDQKDFVHFEFEDNGKGVDHKDLPYIFDRFYRADSSRNSQNGGSGIGLSIVKKIIDAHGGTIWAFSTLNTGLSIHFLLKKANYEAPEETAENIDENNKNIKKGKHKKNG